MMLDFRKMIRESANTKLSMLETCIDDIVRASEIMLKSIKNGNKILWCGNGGSAADAQHMAAELMGGLRSHKRKPIASIALTTDTSFITAWANDISYHHIFSRQIEGLGSHGDVLIAISTSGNSKNILNALETAKESGIQSIILTAETFRLYVTAKLHFLLTKINKSFEFSWLNSYLQFCFPF